MDETAISARLPAPRSDDPPSLRQDIVDELSDHLHCAARSEQLGGADPELARRRAIERFGDPAAIARRLWLLATWRRLMTQKFIVAAISLLGIICLTLACLTGWLVRQQSAAAAEQQRQVADLLAQVARLAESRAQPGAGASVEPTVSSIRLKLTQETPDGSPAAGCYATLRQLGFDKNRTASEYADADGMVDFSYCEPGRYEVTVQTPAGFLSAPRKFLLRPATEHVESVVCPAKPDEVEIAFTTNIPEDLVKAGVSLMAGLPSGVLTLGDEKWFEHGYANRVVHVQSDSWSIAQLVEGNQMGGVPSKLVRAQWQVMLTPLGPVRISPRTHYAIDGVRLVMPAQLDLKVRVGSATGRDFARQVRDLLSQIAPKVDRMQSFGPVPVKSEKAYPVNIEFVAEPGRVNQCDISIPDELIEQAREFLRENPPAESEQ